MMNVTHAVTSSLAVRRLSVLIRPIRDRVLIRPFFPGGRERQAAIAERVLSLDERTASQILDAVLSEFSDRHFDVEKIFRRHYERLRMNVPIEQELSDMRQLLLGAYFTSEYALESAALFNPSIVPHPDQSRLPEGAARFIVSLRATGEGHISSIEFRSGTISINGEVRIEPPGKFVTEPDFLPDPEYQREVFADKLREIGERSAITRDILERLPERFSRTQLAEAMDRLRQQRCDGLELDEDVSLSAIQWLADANYDLAFTEGQRLSERVIFPLSCNESNGIEDARFVRFVDDDTGEVVYYATYTAFNGEVILPQILETRDFRHFRIRTLVGAAARNKGMALFPRRVDGRYAMIGRQDNENMFLMYSNHPYHWREATRILVPTEPWEFVQIGNCGSPIETDQGWLLLTHGVGPMRRYCIGAVLLDLHDPRKVIGRLREPLLQPTGVEREGYVPNVVYSCGGMVHRDFLVLPYAMSDYASSVAIVSMKELLNAME